MAGDLLGISISGLLVSQRGLAVTGQAGSSEARVHGKEAPKTLFLIDFSRFKG